VTFYCYLGFKNLKSRDKVFVAGVVAADVVDVAGVTDAGLSAAVLMCVWRTMYYNALITQAV